MAAGPDLSYFLKPGPVEIRVFQELRELTLKALRKYLRSRQAECSCQGRLYEFQRWCQSNTYDGSQLRFWEPGMTRAGVVKEYRSNDRYLHRGKDSGNPEYSGNSFRLDGNLQ